MPRLPASAHNQGHGSRLWRSGTDFVDDEIRATSFFSDEDDFAGFAGSCGDFKPFNALRVGQNAGQKSIVHLKIAEKDSTITAELNPNIRWGIEQDNQTIRYTLSRDLKNGIDAITECDGIHPDM